MTEEVDNNDDTDEGDSKPPPHKRINLASSQCVITVRNCHHIHHVLAYLSRADPGQPILISDSACDQSLITRDWMVLKWTRHHILMTGAFAGRNVSEKFPVVISAAKLRDENENFYAAIANEALYDNNEAQVESLLSVHQALIDPQNGIDDHAPCERDGKPGRQQARFGLKEVSFFFNGSKWFFEISTITQEEMDTLPRIYIHGRSMKEYVPSIHAHSCRSTQYEPSSNLPPWKYCLGFIPDHVVDKPLSAMTQMVGAVEAETLTIIE
jgi:hypothetical protein